MKATFCSEGANESLVLDREMIVTSEGTSHEMRGRVCSTSKKGEKPIARVKQPIAILGVPFDNVTMGEAVARIEEMIASRTSHYVVTANVDFLVQAREDVELRHILFEAHLVLCDGTPLLWASRFLGNPLRERVAGSDLVPLLIQEAARKNYRVFFLGATPEAAEAAVKQMGEAYPQLAIAGHYSPPFNKLLEMDHKEIKRRIKEARPDLLFVSFGCPKQVKWIAMHYRELGVPVCVGVGATIDFLAGQVKRAPRWMQRAGTEWIFRLGQEPRRLFRRYSKDLRVFGWAILAQWWQLQFRHRQSARGSPALLRRDVNPIAASKPGASKSTEVEMIDVPERLDLAAIQESVLRLDKMNCRSHSMLDLSEVQFIDSSGIGWIVGLQKRIRAHGQQLVLINPSGIVRRALSLMRLEEFFSVAADVESARGLLAYREQQETSAVSVEASASRILWRGEITASNAEEVWQETHSKLSGLVRSGDHHANGAANPQMGDSDKPVFLALDLSEVRFIDSTGLGLMIRMKKLAMAQGMEVAFTGVKGTVENVVRVARLETFLLPQMGD
jgi:N-acetylglucosaminyldiphosphoundecaprenol N-acetyl-beta-D-mannosaminyltransferase